MATDTRTATTPADTDTRAGQDAAAVEAAPIKLEVTVRPIEPRGKLIGFASVNFGGAITVHDFQIFNGERLVCRCSEREGRFKPFGIPGHGAADW